MHHGDVDLDGIDVFVRVVQAGTFSEAARQLGMPKSTVSLRVARLEKRLGVSLLKRTTRSVVPTEAGAAYFATATRVLAELRAAEESVTRAQDELRGTLRISTMGTGGGLIGDLVTAFLARYPRIGVELHLSEHRVDLLAENFDVALRIGRLGHDAGLVAKRIGTSYRKMFASPSYLARHPAIGHPRDLEGHQLLRPTGKHEIELVNERGARFRVPLGGRFSANRVTALRHQALAGIGIAHLPAGLATDDVRTGALCPVLPEWRSDLDPIHLVYPKQPFVPQRVRAFLEFTARTLSADAFTDRGSATH